MSNYNRSDLISPIKGEIIEISENSSYTKKINRNECSWIIPVFYPKIQKTNICKNKSRKYKNIIYTSRNINRNFRFKLSIWIIKTLF